jgi:hypothetical protein
MQSVSAMPPPQLRPPKVVTKIGRFVAANAFWAIFMLLGFIAEAMPSSWEFPPMDVFIMTAMFGSVIVYFTWSVKSPDYMQTLSMQDLVSLMAYLSQSREHKLALIRYLKRTSKTIHSITYLDALMIISDLETD